MKMKLNLKSKMQLFLISLSVAIYGIAIGYISISAKKTSYTDSVDLVISNAEKYAIKIQADLNDYMATVRTLANAFTVYKDMPREQWDPLFIKMYNKVYLDNPSFYKLWDSWELNKIDEAWTNPTGRIANVFSRINGSVSHKQDIRSLDGDPALYAKIKNQSKDMVLPIYFNEFIDENESSRLMTSLISPIIVDNEYHGMIGVDLILERFQKMITNINLSRFTNSFAFLLTEEGKFASYPDTKLLNQIATFTLKTGENFELLKNIKKGENFHIITVDSTKKSHFIAFAPINIGRTNTPWYLGVSVPISSIMAQADSNFMISLIVGLIGILILSFVIYIITKNITDPIQKITEYLKELAQGKTNTKLDLNINSGDEIQEMTLALKTSIEGLNLKTEFANNIESGNLDYEFNLLSDDDNLGLALVEMRNSLKKAKIDEQERKSDDYKRNWATEGLAKFADILRQNNDNLVKLSNEIIKNLVYYMEASQGGLFLLNDENKSDIFLDLISAFAYDRKKHIEKRIAYGDGIVGSVAIEKETTYIEDLPEDYISIVSGLGEANPSALLVVPLKMEDKVFGVIEIASFKKFEKYQIEFVEKVAENIASSMSSVKINIQTNELLDKFQQQSEEKAAQEEELRQNMEEMQTIQEESNRKALETNKLLEQSEQQAEKMAAQEEEMRQNMEEMLAIQEDSTKKTEETNILLEISQQQTEEMAAQEEEMRQNLEELQATQEEADLKNTEMENFLNALEHSSCVVEYNTEAIVTKVNDNYLNSLNLKRSEVLGVHHSDKTKFTKKQKAEYDKFWNDLRKGENKKEKTKYIINGKENIFLEVYTPIMNENGLVNKILKISNNVNDF
ncbi:MAG: GAF domain-containing protein [Bacteroidales bacterium]|nr:GAF domain-containing protein [Bacteroidales bacterium]